MRCPSCGTENAPGSRFCGGCGARLTASTQRVAPTQKISDDARYPQRPPAAAPGHGVPALSPPVDAPRIASRAAPYAPSGPLAAQASAPQPPRAASSAPPAGYAAPPAASVSPNSSLKPAQSRPRPAQAVDDPSLSMPLVARRPWGLIIVVLVIDLGLAFAGGWMLREGLGDTPSAAPRPGGSAAARVPTDSYATPARRPDPSPPGSQ